METIAIASTSRSGAPEKNAISRSCRNHGYNSLYRAVLVTIALLFLTTSLRVAAQCNADELLLGEDADYYYCGKIASPILVGEAVAKLDLLRPEWFGEEWRYRKAVIDVAGCLSRSPRVPYVWGGKYAVPQDCLQKSGLGLDCSGLIAYSNQFAACFINGFYSAAFNALHGLHDRNAADQAKYFKRYGAWVDRGGTPIPGDAIFLEKTYKGCRGICHVAIFLGDTKDGRRLIIHASSTKGVVIVDMPDSWREKQVGYGNISRLYMKLLHKQ